MNTVLQEFTGHYQGYSTENGFTTPQDLLLQQVRTLYDGTMVRRFHTVPTLTENTIGQHSHGVAMLCYLIAGPSKISVNLLMAALTHDIAEQYVGDVPAPSKRAMGVRQAFGDMEDELLDTVGFSFNLSEDETRILKLADCADGMLFCAKEQMLGNHSKRLRHAYANFGKYAHEVMSKMTTGAEKDHVNRLLKAIRHIWKENK